MWNIKAPQGRIPCSIFTKFAEFVRRFRAVNISLDSLKGLWSYGGFKLIGSGYPKIFSALYWRNYASDPEKFLRCTNVLEVLYHHAKFGGARISPAAGAAKNVEFFCLFVCLPVMLLNVRVCVPDFAIKALDTETILLPLDRGRFVVVHPCSTFSDCCQLAIPLNAEVENTAKIGVFAARGRQNKPIEMKFGV